MIDENDREALVEYIYDDYKMSFQKTCTPDYCSIWIEKMNNTGASPEVIH